MKLTITNIQVDDTKLLSWNDIYDTPGIYKESLSGSILFSNKDELLWYNSEDNEIQLVPGNNIWYDHKFYKINSLQLNFEN